MQDLDADNIMNPQWLRTMCQTVDAAVQEEEEEEEEEKARNNERTAPVAIFGPIAAGCGDLAHTQGAGRPWPMPRRLFWGEPEEALPEAPTWTGMFPIQKFQIAPCGTYMIHRENGWTIKDCRTEQRQRWAKIRHAQEMEREKKEREEVVVRWKERARMKREYHR